MSAVDTEIVLAIHELYAELSAALDDGRWDEAAALFAEEAQISYSPGTPPVCTRSGILDDLVRRAAGRDPQVQGRHWIGRSRLRRIDDDLINAVSYAMIVVTPRGGPPTVAVSAVMDDLVERSDDGAYRIRSRTIVRDG